MLRGSIFFAMLCLAVTTFTTITATAQQGSDPVITRSDDKRIKQRAVAILTAFQELLNFIAENELPSDDLDNVIRSSYADPSRRKFFDSTAILVQDLEDRAPNAPPSEDAVRGYLTDFNIFYVKQSEPSIAFSNYKVSNIKKGDHLYLEILYDCKFTSKSRRMESVPEEHKIAFFRVVKEAANWRTYIETVDFYNPADSAKFYQGDVDIAPDPAEAAPTDSAAATPDSALKVRTVLTDEQRERIRKENEALAARKLTDAGDSALSRKDYFMALKNFTYAQKIDESNPYLKARIADVGQLIDARNISPDKQYDIYIQQATLARGQHHYDAARVAYDKALGVKPTEGDKLRPLINELTAKALLVNRIDTKMDDHDFKGALEQAKTGVTQYPSDPVFLLKRARAYEAQNDAKQARKDYAKAVDMEPGYLEAYLVRGAYYERIRDYSSALSDYTVVAQTDKNNDSVYLYTAALDVDKNDVDKALLELDKGIAINPARFAFYEQKGELEFDRQHKADAAMGDFSTAILKDPTVAKAWYYRGLTEVSLEKFDDAARDLAQARALKLEPSLDDHVTALSTVWVARGDKTNAIDDYTEAILLNRKNDTAYQQRGRAQYVLGNYAASVSDLDSSIALNGQVPEKYLYRGNALYKMARYDVTIKDMDAVVSTAKTIKKELPEATQAQVADLKGECFYEQGNYTAALDNFKNAIKLNKAQNPDYLYDRGRAYLKLNQLKDAQADLSQAAHGDSANRYVALGDVYQKQGNYAGAADAYTEAIKRGDNSALYPRAMCRMKAASYDGALADLQALKAAGRPYDAMIGTAYVKTNRPDSAIASFQAVLAKDEGDADALYGMGAANIEKNQKDEALAWFGKAFATGKIHRSQVKEDKTLDPVKDDKAFKALLKKYSDQMPK